ncbi:MAG: SpoIIE family protein phosphatase [Planctomycetota bacterium]
MSDLHLYDPKRAPYRWEAYSRTAGEFGGDYAEAFPSPPDGLVALLSSNAEPGTAGAAWMMLTRSVYRLAAMTGKKPSETLLATHQLLSRDAPGVAEAAACVRVDFPQRRLTWARAGDVLALLGRAGARVEELAGAPSPLGTGDAAREVQDAETGWDPGDVLVLCGAGTARVENASAQPFGVPRLVEALAAAPRTAKEAVAWLTEAIDRHAGTTSRSVDVSLLAVELGEAR